MDKEQTVSTRNLFEDLGFPPEEAQNLRIRSQLMIDLTELIHQLGLTQDEAARLFGVTQPRVSDLVRGKIDRFSIDALVNMLAKVGVKVEFSVVDPSGGHR